MIQVIQGDCREVLKTLPDCSVDAVVTDPPAGIGFMGKEWDDFRRQRNPADAGRDNAFGRTSKTGPEYGRCSRANFIDFLAGAMKECLRVLKPGGHALVWSIPRTSHWTGTAVEDAGFEVRDCICHLFGTGFPKSLNLEGGLGTALKPAAEYWWLVRKPLEGTVEANVAKWGVGALSIDLCRLEYTSAADQQSAKPQGKATSKKGALAGGSQSDAARSEFKADNTKGRWPANVMYDGSEEVLAHFPPASKPGKQPKADRAGEASAETRYTNSGGANLAAKPGVRRAATGDVSRFFYTAKPSKAERGEGNDHPTVKPIALMRYLCRLVTPPGGVVLDPFAGSGTTLLAAREEGFRAIGIEREQHYIDIINQRLK